MLVEEKLLPREGRRGSGGGGGCPGRPGGGGGRLIGVPLLMELFLDVKREKEVVEEIDSERMGA